MKQRMLWLLLIIPLAFWTVHAAASSEDEAEETGTGTAGEAAARGIPEGDQARARELFADAQRLYLAGNFREALAGFQEAYETWQHPEFLWNIAQAYRRNDDWANAIATYNRYIAAYRQAGLDMAQFPHVVHVHIAECQFGAGHEQQAIQALERYLQDDPQGECRALAQQCIERRRSPREVERRDPETVREARRLHDEATALHQRRQFQQAAERFLEGYERYSDITEFLFNAASSYRTGRLWRDAARIYGQYLETPGASPEGYIELAQCLHEMGRFDDAVAAYRSYLQAEPHGTFSESARQYIQTVTAASTGGSPPSEENVERARLAFERGLEHYRQGRWNRARQELEESYDILATPETLYNIGLCYTQMRQWERALTNFDNYLEHHGDAGHSAMVHIEAARCLIEMRQLDEAREHLDRYMQRADHEELPNEERDRGTAARLLQRCGGSSGSD